MKLQVLNHFRPFLGAGELVSSRDGIEVYKWGDPFDMRNVVLTTLGMMERHQFTEQGTGEVPDRMIELLMFCRPHDIGLIAQLLTDIAAYPDKAKANIHWWHVLPLGHAIAPDSRLRHLLFTVPPLTEDFCTVRCQGKRVDIAWVIPIADGERAIFESKGVDALERQLEEKNVVVADLFRDPIA